MNENLDYISPDLRPLAVPIETLTLDPVNARLHPVFNLEGIKGSLKKFGQQKPVVAGQNGVLIAGNGQLLAARELGWTHLAAVHSELRGADATAYGIADNATGLSSEWNDQTLAGLIEGLRAEDYEMEALGFSLDELDAIASRAADEADAILKPDADLDEVPDDAPTRCNLGDLWALGEHLLLCGDSTKAPDVARLMGDKVADMVFTDPPYGVAYVGKTKDALQIENDDLGDAGTRDLVRDSAKLWPLKPGGAFYVCSPAGRTETAFRLALEDAGLELRQCLVWVKQAFVLGRQDYHWRHESILYGWQGGAAHFFVDDRTQDTVWEFDRPNRNGEHPTMKPVALVTKAILNSSLPGALIYEPFGGSGTTLMAAHSAKRRCAAIELSPAYCDVILKRFQDATGIEPNLLASKQTV